MQSSQSHEGTVVSEVNILADELQADRSKPDRSPEADAAFFRQKWQEEKSPERMLALETLSLTMGLSTASLGQREVPPTVNVSISDPPLPACRIPPSLAGIKRL